MNIDHDLISDGKFKGTDPKKAMRFQNRVEEH